MPSFSEIAKTLLTPGDLRTTGNSGQLVQMVDTQEKFDALFELMADKNRGLAMRAADAVEKCSHQNTGWLQKHKQTLFAWLAAPQYPEVSWHLAQLAGYLNLNPKEAEMLINLLLPLCQTEQKSRIVRVMATDTLLKTAYTHQTLLPLAKKVIFEAEKDNIPSLNARIRKLKKQYR